MTEFCSKHFKLNRNQQALLLAGELYSISQIITIADKYLQYHEQISNCDNNQNTTTQHLTTIAAQDLPAIYAELFIFLKDWFGKNTHLSVKTSGSTGQAKCIEVEKDKMINSAAMTCSFFELPEKASTLLCMPLQYIGAKMLVVRALVAGLDLYVTKSSTKPLKFINRCFDFVPMTPQQLSCSLECEEEVKKINNIKHILLGGMSVSKLLERQCAKLQSKVWSSYGMTETLSHIALRSINAHQIQNKVALKKVSASTLGQSSFFTPLAGVEISLSKQNTLIINAPYICTNAIQTNDMVKINEDNTFEVLGRLDNVVNSGGIKIALEELEEQLMHCLQVPLQVTSVPDEVLGEKVVLLLEKDYPNWPEKCHNINKYWRPKLVFIIQALPKTETHKPDRSKAKALALESLQQYMKNA